jgi:hypothetical protein
VDPVRDARLRLLRAANITLGTDPSLVELHRARFEGTRPRSGCGAGC